jgi:hypothetical protein
MKRPVSFVHLSFDFLEERDVPAPLVWIGDENGVWSDSSNWIDFNTSEHRTPEATDTLVFGELNGTNTSSIDDIPDLTVANITEGSGFDGQIDIHNSVGLLDVTNNSTFYGKVIVRAEATFESGAIYLFGELETQTEPMVFTEVLHTSLLNIPTTGKFSITGTTASAQMTVDVLTMGSGSTWDIATGLSVSFVGGVGSSGDITVAAATSVSVSGTWSSSGHLTLDDGSTLAVSGSSPVSLSGDTTTIGSVIIDAASVQFNAPGVLELESPFGNDGLTVTGDLAIQSGTVQFDNLNTNLFVGGNFSVNLGTLKMNVSFNQGLSNVIVVNGDVSLNQGGANLDIVDLDSPGPLPQIFTFITCQSGSGGFQNIFTDDTGTNAGWVSNGQSDSYQVTLG